MINKQMKAKNILGVATAAMLGITLASCTDGNDWDVNGAFDRLFGVDGNKITVTPGKTTADITFQKRSDAQYYIMEVSTDSLYDDVPMGGENAIVYGEDGSITSTPTTLSGLGGDTKYYFRMKSMAEGKSESKWVYYKDGEGFKTLAEQIFNELTSADITDSSVKLTWDANEEADHIVLTPGVNGEESTTITLTTEDKATGTLAITNLNASTSYSAIIYNGKAKRGELSFSTSAAPPSADYKIYYDANTGIQNQLDAVAEEAAAAGKTNYGVTVVFAANSEVTFNGMTEDQSGPASLKIPSGMSVTFYGNPGGEKPVLKMGKTLDASGSHAFIQFINVNLQEAGSGYFFNQSAASTVSEFTLEDCVVKDFASKSTFFRLQGTETKTIGTLKLINCMFDNIGSGYSFIHVDAGAGKGKVENIDIDGCTFSNICVKGKMFIYGKNTDMTSINLKNSTFYNVIGGGQYFIDFGSDTYGPSSFNIENCLFGKSADEATNKNIRAKITPSVTNCYKTSDFFKNIKGTNDIGFSSADLFVDAANGNFSFKPGTTSLSIGDPRWLK